MTYWPVKTLDDLCNEGVVSLGRGNIISKKDIAANPGPYPIYSSARENEGKFGEYGDFMFDEEMITWSIDGGGRLFYRQKHKFSVTNVGGTLRVLNPKILEIRYLHRALENLHSRKVFDWVFKAHPSVIRKVYDEIPVPPLEEQKRIVALLDAATARVTELTACYEQARTHATNLFTKALDVVIFKDESSHVESALKHLTTKIGSGATPTGGQESYKTAGVPLIRSMNVHDSEFDVKGLAYIDSQQAQKLDGVTVEEGDVLLNITGASLTRTCIVPPNLVPARVNQHVSILRVKPELINEHYLQLFLVCARTKSLLWEIGGAAGSTRQALTKKDLEELVVKYPLALESQNMIVEEANKLASAVTEFVGLIDAKLTAAKNLRQSILEAAFAGGL
jgi:restriction endonuclease S subunit